jgi:hypothetical protein
VVIWIGNDYLKYLDGDIVYSGSDKKVLKEIEEVKSIGKVRFHLMWCDFDTRPNVAIPLSSPSVILGIALDIYKNPYKMQQQQDFDVELYGYKFRWTGNNVYNLYLLCCICEALTSNNPDDIAECKETIQWKILDNSKNEQ